MCAAYVRAVQAEAPGGGGDGGDSAAAETDSGAALETLLRRVKLFVEINHMYWGVWAVNRAFEEGCAAFDFMGYASSRFTQINTAPAALALAPTLPPPAPAAAPSWCPPGGAAPALDLALLVGMTGAAAKAQIEATMNGVAVHVLPEGAMVTMDFRTDRVRVFVNSAGLVAKPPRRG